VAWLCSYPTEDQPESFAVSQLTMRYVRDHQQRPPPFWVGVPDEDRPVLARQPSSLWPTEISSCKTDDLFASQYRQWAVTLNDDPACREQDDFQKWVWKNK
jgi:hypothetical protein